MRYAFLSTRKSPSQDFQKKNHPAHELAPGGATTSLAKGETCNAPPCLRLMAAAVCDGCCCSWASLLTPFLRRH